MRAWITLRSEPIQANESHARTHAPTNARTLECTCVQDWQCTAGRTCPNSDDVAVVLADTFRMNPRLAEMALDHVALVVVAVM